MSRRVGEVAALLFGFVIFACCLLAMGVNIVDRIAIREEEEAANRVAPTTPGSAVQRITHYLGESIAVGDSREHLHAVVRTLGSVKVKPSDRSDICEYLTVDIGRFSSDWVLYACYNEQGRVKSLKYWDAEMPVIEIRH